MLMPRYSYQIFIFNNYKYLILNCLRLIFLMIKKLIPNIIYFRIKSIITLVNILITRLITTLITFIKLGFYKMVHSISSVYKFFICENKNTNIYNKDIYKSNIKFLLLYFNLLSKWYEWKQRRKDYRKNPLLIELSDDELFLLFLFGVYIICMKKVVMTLHTLIYGLIFLLPPILLFFLGP